MNRIKEQVINTIDEIPDNEATSVEALLNALFIRYQVMQGLDDVEKGNVMTINQLREDIAKWK